MTGLLAEAVKCLLEQFDYQPDYSKCQGEPFANDGALVLVLFIGLRRITS